MYLYLYHILYKNYFSNKYYILYKFYCKKNIQEGRYYPIQNKITLILYYCYTEMRIPKHKYIFLTNGIKKIIKYYNLIDNFVKEINGHLGNQLYKNTFLENKYHTFKI